MVRCPSKLTMDPPTPSPPTARRRVGAGRGWGDERLTRPQRMRSQNRLARNPDSRGVVQPRAGLCNFLFVQGGHINRYIFSFFSYRLQDVLKAVLSAIDNQAATGMAAI